MKKLQFVVVLTTILVLCAVPRVALGVPYAVLAFPNFPN